MPDTPAPTSARTWAALGVVYVVWGSTYLAINLSIRTVPPLLMAAARFLLAGGLLYALAARSGDREGDRPGLQQWVAAAVVGTGLLAGGNGAVVWAEQHVDTGTAALVIAAVPLWMALLDRLLFGARLARAAVVGLALGLGGVAVLVEPQGGRDELVGVAVLLGASVSWAGASLYARQAALPARPLVATGMEMLAGGAVLGLAALLSGEHARFRLASVSAESALAFAYLVVFGSLLAFSSYVWLLRAAPISLVSTYAYVNPVVAVLLGTIFLSEDVTVRTAVAAVAIVAAVALIVRAHRPPSPATEALGPEPAHVPPPAGGSGTAGEERGAESEAPAGRARQALGRLRR